MERSAIRSVAFGGFDKEDVARYIEQLSQETEKLREERDALQEKADCLEKEADELKTQVQDLSKDKEELSAEVARLAPLEKENAQLNEEVETLRPDAEAHVMLRGQVGAIECEARQRAAELEEHTAGQMHKALDLFRQQYQILMSTFETASSHMTAELRKMEVTLAQLPRTMDQSGVELDRLASALEKGTDAKSDKK
mgnify:FL=1